MKKLNYLLVLSSLALCSPVLAQQSKVKYTIKPSIEVDSKGVKKALIKADDAIKNICYWAKIENYSIDEDVMELPGKYINLSNTDLSILTEMVLSSFKLKVDKSVYEDGTVFYQFSKMPEKLKVIEITKSPDKPTPSKDNKNSRP